MISQFSLEIFETYLEWFWQHFFHTHLSFLVPGMTYLLYALCVHHDLRHNWRVFEWSTTSLAAETMSTPSTGWLDHYYQWNHDLKIWITFASFLLLFIKQKSPTIGWIWTAITFSCCWSIYFLDKLKQFSCQVASSASLVSVSFSGSGVPQPLGTMWPMLGTGTIDGIWAESNEKPK